MDRPELEKVAKLLAKAQSTPFDPEAMALLDKCCQLLRAVISGPKSGLQSMDTGSEDLSCSISRSGATGKARVASAYRHFLNEKAVVRERRPASAPHIDVNT